MCAFYYLDCKVYTRHLVDAFVYDAEPSPAELLADHVVVLDRDYLSVVLHERHPVFALLLALAVQHTLVVAVVLPSTEILASRYIKQHKYKKQAR